MIPRPVNYPVLEVFPQRVVLNIQQQTTGASTPSSFLLMETGDALLLETGDKIILNGI